MANNQENVTNEPLLEGGNDINKTARDPVNEEGTDNEADGDRYLRLRAQYSIFCLYV